MKTDQTDEKTGETSSHCGNSDTSSSSAITPMSNKHIHNHMNKINNVSLPLPPPIPLTLHNSNNNNNSIGTSSTNSLLHTPINNRSNNNSTDSMVQLTTNQYAQLLSKIESLENTQAQQRKK
eukprot:TRINITY_DN8270_c0_g1_i1.p1 TRINITY_DN8270_c0_g1~~TRINITY_DN8270_c0_g1_i1.p1  ORF type:complete len:122 (+),score=26.30 TRINITY_DN8270_c0_g1_i1:50-415(+)